MTDRWTKFGRWVEQERTARRLSKAEACKLSGISPSSWYNVEHGGRIKDGKRVVHQPSTETLLGIATAFDMEPVEVFKAAGVSLPQFVITSRTPDPEEEVRVTAHDARAGTFTVESVPPATEPGLLSLLAQLLAEQRELRSSLQALRDEVALLRVPARR